MTVGRSAERQREAAESSSRLQKPDPELWLLLVSGASFPFVKKSVSGRDY